jgi:hypothetical protein
MKRSKAFVLLLVIVGALCLGMSSCPLKKPDADLSADNSPGGPGIEPGSTASPQPPQRVHYKKYGITIITPADWTIARRTSNPVLFAVAPGAGDHGPMVNVVVEDLSQRLAPFDYLQANIVTMRVSLPGLETKGGGVEFSGPEAPAWIHYAYPRGDVTIEAIAYCRTKDYRAYVVTAMAPADRFPEHEALFRTIGRSLRID